MSPLVLIGAGLGAVVIIGVILLVLRSRRDFVFLHAPESADASSRIPEALRSHVPDPAPRSEPKPEPQPEPVIMEREPEPEPSLMEQEPEPQLAPQQPETVETPEELVLVFDHAREAVAEIAENPVPSVLLTADSTPEPEPAPEPVPEPGPALEPEPAAERENAPEPILGPASTSDTRASVADFAMEAPVEVWLGDVRVGIRHGSASHRAFLKYANTLLADLKATRTVSR